MRNSVLSQNFGRMLTFLPRKKSTKKYQNPSNVFKYNCLQVGRIDWVTRKRIPISNCQMKTCCTTYSPTFVLWQKNIITGITTIMRSISNR